MRCFDVRKSGAAVTLVFLGACTLAIAGCRAPEGPKADYVVTLAPLKMLLDPLVEGRKSVTCLVPPGVSPHVFALRPSGARQLSAAETVFYVDDSLDGWAADLAPGKGVALFNLIPEGDRLPGGFAHSHNAGEHGLEAGGRDFNPHFWSDPRIVAALVPEFVRILVERDPQGRDRYEANATKFLAELEQLDLSLSKDMGDLPEAALVAFHPSWSYFFARYGLPVAAYVEPIPGKELSPRGIIALREQLTGAKRVVVLSEVQLPRKSADALAETLGARVCEIDPLGGRGPLASYSGLLRHNAARLREAFQ